MYEKLLSNKVRAKDIIMHEGSMWMVVKTAHSVRGRGHATITIEMRNLRNNVKLTKKFTSNDSFEKLYVTKGEFTYLYSANEMISLVNTEGEIVELSETILGEKLPLLQENMKLSIIYADNEPVSVEFPIQITVEVIDTEAVIKGQTASSSFKPAIIQGGFTVAVPYFIEKDDQIVISTENMEYLHRAKNN